MRALLAALALLTGCLLGPLPLEEVPAGPDASAPPARELPPRWETLYEDAGPVEIDVPRMPADVGIPRADVVDVVIPRADVPATPRADVPITPSGEPCGRYQGWNVWSCIDGRTRVRCIANVLQRDTCASRCVVQPVGVDDFCESPSTVPDDACSGARTCGPCASQWNCGFCRSLGRCFLGTGWGPINRACGSADWVWDPNTCGSTPPPTPMPTPTPPPTPTPTPPAADACGTSTTCDACSSRSGCGYCASTRRCEGGNSAGPNAGDCPIGQWRWQPSECSGAVDAGAPPPPPPVVDAGAPPPPPSPGMCVGTAPTGGFCTSPGACAFQAPDTTSCESRGAYDFYGAEHCAARATVIVVGAGWCGACQTEAPQVESQITQAYRSRGVRVVSLLTENSDRSPATVDFGLRWQSRFGLSSRMVVDPTRSITRRVRLNAYPFVVLVDRRGQLRMAEAAPRLPRVRSLLDTVLAEP